MIRPMVSSWFAEIVPTWAIIGPLTGLDCCLSDATTASTAATIPRLMRHRVGAGRDVLRAFAIDGLRQHGRRGRAVSGDVGGLARDFAHHLGAHVLERIRQVDFLGHRDAVLGDRGRSEGLAQDDVASLGSEGHLHGVGQAVDAAENGLARRVAVCNQFCHVSVPSGWWRLFVVAVVGGDGLGGDDGALDRGEHFVFLHDQVLDAVQLDLLAGVLAEEDGVARLHVELHPIAVVVHLAVARGDHRAPLRFFLGGIRNDDAADLLFAFVEALNENPVV